MSGRLIFRRLGTRPPPRQNIRKPETEPSEQFQEAVCFVVAKKRNAPFKEENKTKQNKRIKECYAYKNLKQQILSTKTEKSISKMPTTKTESPQIPLK